MPVNKVRNGEFLIPIPLPFVGSGKLLRKRVEQFVRRMNKAIRAA
jgi:hypothetical protein